MWRLGWLAVIVLAASVAAPTGVIAQCDPGDEFCPPDPPCYREPDNPDCNPDCTCASPDYPQCDPYCAPGDICDPDCANPCWDEFDREDICSDPPPPCEAMTGELPFEFVDDGDGLDDGQIYAVNGPNEVSDGGSGGRRGCGTVRVDTTAYYSIFDAELSESCDDQRDETGYLTIANTCNPDGWAVERNAGERFLVFDSDNSGRGCTTDGECEAGLVCREAGSHGRCCVPNAPVFMGTFLLVAGEDNEICIHHWCPEWEVEIAAGNDFGFVQNDCGDPGSINSIHFQIDASAIACEDETTLQPCSWGCGDTGCNPDPCDAADCPRFCMDGVCTDTNPCDSVTCEHGCVRGRCLQNRHARGPDEDGDGYSSVADCDDDDPNAHPGHPEICADGADNDCDGTIDESMCEDGPDGGSSRMDGSTAGLDGGTGGRPGLTDGGCGCRAATRSSPSPAWALLALGLVLARRRR